MVEVEAAKRYRAPSGAIRFVLGVGEEQIFVRNEDKNDPYFGHEYLIELSSINDNWTPIKTIIKYVHWVKLPSGHVETITDSHHDGSIYRDTELIKTDTVTCEIPE